MSNSTPVVITVTGTTTASDTDEDFAIAGGTQLDKMWHLWHCRMTYNTGALDFNIRTTHLSSSSNLKVLADNAPIAQTFHAFVVAFLAGDDITVQHLSWTYPTSGTSYDVAVTAVDLSRSWVLMHGMSDIASSGNGLGSATEINPELTSTTNLRLYNLEYSISAFFGSADARAELIDWGNSDVAVQQVAVSIPAADVDDYSATITAVVLANTWVVSYWSVGPAFGTDTEFPAEEWSYRVDLPDTTHVRQRRDVTTGLYTVSWTAYVIMGAPFSVQHLTGSMATAVGSVAIACSAITTARAFTANAARSGGLEVQTGLGNSSADAGNGGRVAVDASFTSTTQVTLVRTSTTGAMAFDTQVIEFANAQSNAPRALDHYRRRRAA